MLFNDEKHLFKLHCFEQACSMLFLMKISLPIFFTYFSCQTNNLTIKFQKLGDFFFYYYEYSCSERIELCVMALQ